ncbi:4-hydroxy-2-oxoglutarate aldolase [Microdochium nivale]|nr:4-hydroxy-2-oxoglutarate aldolase [Microdochium nivale]
MAPHLNTSSPSGSFSGTGQSFSQSMLRSRVVDTQVIADDSDSYRSGTSMSSDYEGIQTQRRLRPGVYVPTMCFFDDESEDLDLDTIARHAVRLAQSGVTGLATQGSNGEAVHLSHHERQLVTSTTRKALNDSGFARMPIIVGCGAQSTREAISLCREAWEAGGDYALVLPPSYYAGLFAPGSETIVRFFTAVADASPIPLIIYNYPGAVNGMDLSSDLIIKLSQHPNIVGVKLTCGNTGKLNRIAAATRNKPSSRRDGPSQSEDAVPEANQGPSETTDFVPDFLVLAGSADFTIQSLIAGGHGILAGLANIAPRACSRVMELYGAKQYAEAQAMQEVVSRGDWTAIQGGVVGVKAGLQGWSGYGGYGRSPLPRPTADEARKWKEGFRELVVLEKSL